MGLIYRCFQSATRSHQAAIAARINTRKMSAMSTPMLLTPRQLLDMDRGMVAVLDTTWYMPNIPRDPKIEFLSKRLPNAQFLSLDEVASEHELGLKHMMPSPKVFAEACENLGITPSTHVVLYDASGVFSSPRALFTFRAFGHDKSSVLDGGMPRWQAEGLPIQTTSPATKAEKTTYPLPSLDETVVRSYEQMVSIADQDLSDMHTEIVLDARSAGRFTGRDPEPRPGMSSGHMPNSFSLPFNAFLQTHTTASGDKYTTFLEPEGIRQALIKAVGLENAEQIIDGQRAVTTTCGSGMTAAVLWLGLQLLGVRKLGLYDESWTGYALRSTSKILKDD